MQINREEIAWAAGFFDGEGHIRCSSAQRKFGLTYYPNISVTQSNEQMLERFREAVGGLGHIHKRGTKVNLDLWTWTSGRYEHIQQTVCMLWPWLSEPKRMQSYKAFKVLQEHKALSPRGFYLKRKVN